MASMESFQPSGPFGGANPFIGTSPFGGVPMGGNPFGGSLPGFMKESSKTDDSDSFNIDDLVKKIDAKIAEIEKEEELAKEKKESEEVSVKDLVPNKTIDASFEDKDDTNVVNETENKVEAEDKNEVTTIYEDNTDDDDFFDDFFSDDD